MRFQATLDEAEASISELEKGFWNISSSGRAIDLPAREDGDVEVPIQMWKNVFVRYHHYTIRNCKTFLMRINHNGELKDTVTYTSIKGVNCMKDGFSEIVFMPTVPFDKWTMYTEGRGSHSIHTTCRLVTIGHQELPAPTTDYHPPFFPKSVWSS